MNRAPTTDERDVYRAAPQPVRVGVLMDMPSRIADVALSVYEQVIEEFQASGRLERGVALLVERVAGAPSGYIKACIDGYHALCDAGALVVIGPNHSDQNIALTAHAEERRVPVVALGATAEHLSRHVFSIGWGSIPDDAYLCANWLARQGRRDVAVTWDLAHHSAEYVRHFRAAASRWGLRVMGDVRFSQFVGAQLDDQMARALEVFRRLDPEGLVHFGTSESAGEWARAVNESGWQVPRIMNGAFFGATDPTRRANFEGWVGSSLVDDENEVLTAAMGEWARRHSGDPAPVSEIVAHYRDAITATLEGLALAPILTPDGLLAGLESVRMLPAASGGPRTVISFGPGDRRGLKGPDVMVLRKVENGDLVPAGRFSPVLGLPKSP